MANHRPHFPQMLKRSDSHFSHRWNGVIVSGIDHTLRYDFATLLRTFRLPDEFTSADEQESR